MKLFISSFVIGLFVLFSSHVYAQNNVNLEANVGRFYFSASGIASPYASIVMTSQDFFLSSTVANQHGEFALPEAIVNDGFDEFCLEAIDVRRIGVSYTCFEVDPPTRDFRKDRIFLPPTVGLSGRKIVPNSSITASGYSMPGADVDINVSEEIMFEVRADEDGYYDYELAGGVTGGIPQGTYELYATATYVDKDSEIPTKTFSIEVLGVLSSIPAWFTYFSFLILLLVFLLIILFLIWRKRRKKEDKKKPKKKTKKRVLPFVSRA